MVYGSVTTQSTALVPSHDSMFWGLTPGGSGLLGDSVPSLVVIGTKLRLLVLPQLLVWIIQSWNTWGSFPTK